jgi:peptidoglycan pentaglycine glycine transferase (the first glycine)
VNTGVTGELMLDPEIVPDDEWDTFVANHPDGHHEQCSGFSRQRERFGFHVERLVLRHGTTIVGGAQILRRKTTLGHFGFLFRAPLVSSGYDDALSCLGKAILIHAERKGYAGLRVELFPNQVQAQDELAFLGCSPISVTEGDSLSCIVPLAVRRGELTATMHYNVRRYSGEHRSQSGLRIENAGREGLLEFHRLYSATSDFHSFPRFPRTYFDYLWDVFGAKGKLYCLLALLDGEPIAGIVNTVVGSRMYYGWGGMVRRPSARRAVPNYPLHLAAMQIARARGLTHYDFTGTSPFKRQFAASPSKWPAPMQQYFGKLSQLRWWASRQYCRVGIVDRTVARLSGALRLYPQMPY